MSKSPTPPAERELILTRDIDLPASALYRAWTARNTRKCHNSWEATTNAAPAS